MIEERLCSRCKTKKEETAFAPALWKQRKRGLWCRACQSEYQQERQSKTPPQHPTYQGGQCFRGHSGERYVRSRACVTCKKMSSRERKRLTKDDPMVKFWRRIYRKYGVRVEDFNRMLAEQGGVCAICKDHNRSGYSLAVDHCHETGMVRGLLCQSCNAGIGQLKESQRILMAAMQYLAKHSISTNESGVIPFPTIPRAVDQGG